MEEAAGAQGLTNKERSVACGSAMITSHRCGRPRKLLELVGFLFHYLKGTLLEMGEDVLFEQLSNLLM